MGFNESIKKIEFEKLTKYYQYLVSKSIINVKAGLKHDWNNTYYGIKTNKYVQTSLIYIDVIDAQ